MIDWEANRAAYAARRLQEGATPEQVAAEQVPAERTFVKAQEVKDFQEWQLSGKVAAKPEPKPKPKNLPIGNRGGGKPRDPELTRRIKEAHERGLTVPEVASEVGVHVVTVRGHLRAEGIEPRQAPKGPRATCKNGHDMAVHGRQKYKTAADGGLKKDGLECRECHVERMRNTRAEKQ